MIKPFGFIFDPVLPVTLDESKSSYEFLSKVLYKLNEVIKLANKLETDVNNNINEVNAMLKTINTIKVEVQQLIQELSPANLINDNFGNSQIKSISQLSLTNILQPLLNILTQSIAVSSAQTNWATAPIADIFCLQLPLDWLIVKGVTFLYDLKIPLNPIYPGLNGGIYYKRPDTITEWNTPLYPLNVDSTALTYDFLNLNAAEKSNVIYIAFRISKLTTAGLSQGGSDPHLAWNPEFKELIDRPGPQPIPLIYYYGTWNTNGNLTWKTQKYYQEFNLSFRYLEQDAVTVALHQNQEVKEE